MKILSCITTLYTLCFCNLQNIYHKNAEAMNSQKKLAHKIFRLYSINLLLFQLSSNLQIIIYKFQKNCFFSGSIYGACGSYTTTVIYCYCYGCFAQMFNEDDILGISLNQEQILEKRVLNLHLLHQ